MSRRVRSRIGDCSWSTKRTKNMFGDWCNGDDVTSCNMTTKKKKDGKRQLVIASSRFPFNIIVLFFSERAVELSRVRAHFLLARGRKHNNPLSSCTVFCPTTMYKHPFDKSSADVRSIFMPSKIQYLRASKVVPIQLPLSRLQLFRD